MSIEIMKNKCTGCRMCMNICPGNLIYSDENGKAFIKYNKDCWGCTACIKECKFSAINYVISPQIGGKGGRLNVREEDEKLIWTVERRFGERIVIEVDKTESNKY